MVKQRVINLVFAPIACELTSSAEFLELGNFIVCGIDRRQAGEFRLNSHSGAHNLHRVAFGSQQSGVWMLCWFGADKGSTTNAAPQAPLIFQNLQTFAQSGARDAQSLGKQALIGQAFVFPGFLQLAHQKP